MGATDVPNGGCTASMESEGGVGQARRGGLWRGVHKGARMSEGGAGATHKTVQRWQSDHPGSRGDWPAISTTEWSDGGAIQRESPICPWRAVGAFGRWRRVDGSRPNAARVHSGGGILESATYRPPRHRPSAGDEAMRPPPHATRTADGEAPRTARANRVRRALSTCRTTRSTQDHVAYREGASANLFSS